MQNVRSETLGLTEGSAVEIPRVKLIRWKREWRGFLVVQADIERRIGVAQHDHVGHWKQMFRLKKIDEQTFEDVSRM